VSTTIADVRDTMSNAIRQGTNIRAMAYQTSNLPHPVAVITPLQYDPRYVLGKSTADYPFKVSVVVGPASEVHAQKLCDRLREPDGDGSIVAAIEDADYWTDTAIQYVSVTSVGEVGEVAVSEETLLVFEVEATVVW